MIQRPRALLACLFATASVSLGAQPPAPSQPPAAFRSAVTLVPVDVRVLDRNGKPISDLKQGDFTILEDGKRQQIEYFEASTLAPQTPVAGAAPARRGTLGEALAPQKQRIFLIVLGRGRLQEPATKVVDAAIRFTRERLLPQDQVAVLAYNRASRFTTDHEETGVLLQRFKQLHEPIEAKLQSHFSGLAAVYGGKNIPASIQADIDAIFRGAGQVRQVPPGGVPGAGRIADDADRAAAALMRGDILAGRDTPPGGSEADRTFDLAAAELIGLPFDEYVEKNLQTTQDLGNIYTGIAYMRELEGEKHLVFITERGLFLPRLEDDESIAALANDARVAIDVIHSGGFPAPRPPTVMGPMGGPPGRPMAALPTPSVMFNQMTQIQTSRTVADLTGGRASAYKSGDDAFAGLDRATRFEYLLGYYPANATVDGKYRRITVRVNRAGATVLFRHGYYARRRMVTFNRQQFLTYTRIAAAGNYQGALTDLGLRLSAAKGQQEELLVTVTILPDRVAFVRRDGRHAASLDVALFCGDSKENIVGQAWQKVDLTLREEVYQTFLRDGASYTSRVAVKGDAKFVKGIVYDYAADLLGSAVVTVGTRK